MTSTESDRARWDRKFSAGEGPTHFEPNPLLTEHRTLLTGGRALLGRFNGDRIQLSEVHRFPNGPVRLPEGLQWDILRLWSEVPQRALASFRGASVACEVAPELLGVGYIIGPRIAGITVAGGVLSYLVLAPAIAFFGAGSSAPTARSCPSTATRRKRPGMST